MAFLMKYPIETRYLSGPSKRRPMTPIQRITFMVAHDTGNPGSTARGNVGYYERTRDDDYASAHTFIDDTQIIECIPLTTGDPEVAYHVIYDVPTDNLRFGDDANDAAGGVELCYGGSIDNWAAYRRYVWYFAYCYYKFGINGDNVTTHYLLDPERKIDPKSAFGLLDVTFDSFLAEVRAEYQECLEEDDSMPMKLTEEQWGMLYEVFGKAYNDDKIAWGWMQKIKDKTMTATDCAFLNTVLDGRIDRKIDV